MLSLLLTLFISLFSICPSNYKVEDHNENNIIEDFELPKEKKLITYDNYYLVSSGDFSFVHLYNATVEVLGDDFSISNSSPKTYSWNVSTGNVYIMIRNNQTNNNITSAFSQGSMITSIDIEKVVTSSSNYSYLWRFNYTENSVSKNLQLDFIVTFNMIYDGEPVIDNAIVERSFIITNGTYNFWPYNYYLKMFKYGDLSTDIFIDAILNESSNYEIGYNDGFYTGFEEGNRNGYQDGYQQALDDNADYSSTASTIFEGIFDVGLLPVNVFLTIFNFEVFGVNIAGIVSGLLTLAVVVIILRFLLGGKKDDK